MQCVGKLSSVTKVHISKRGVHDGGKLVCDCFFRLSDKKADKESHSVLHTFVIVDQNTTMVSNAKDDAKLTSLFVNNKLHPKNVDSASIHKL